LSKCELVSAFGLALFQPTGLRAREEIRSTASLIHVATLRVARACDVLRRSEISGQQTGLNAQLGPHVPGGSWSVTTGFMLLRARAPALRTITAGMDRRLVICRSLHTLVRLERDERIDSARPSGKLFNLAQGCCGGRGSDRAWGIGPHPRQRKPQLSNRRLPPRYMRATTHSPAWF